MSQSCNKIEVCGTPLKESLQGPSLQSWSLKNGTKCVIASMGDAPLTCLDLWFRAGSSTERIGEEGIAHFLEHMVFKGSSCLKSGEFDTSFLETFNYDPTKYAYKEENE